MLKPSPCLDRRCFRRRLAVLAVLSLLTASAGAEMPDLVDAVLDVGPPDASDRCSYTRTRVEPDRTKTERYVATDDDTPWELISLDGEPPTPARLRSYRADAEDREDRRHPLAYDIRSMVEPEGWERVSETDGEAVFRFRLRPIEGLSERVMDKVRGTMVIHKNPLRPVRITIENTEPTYVAPFVRIAEYFQELEFAWDDDLESPVLTQITTRRRGRAFGFRSLNQDKIVRYYDYRCVDGG